MADGLDFDIIGDKSLSKMFDRLDKLGGKELKKDLKKSMRKTLKPMLTAARNSAPVLSGRLRKAIKIKTMKGQRDGVGFMIFIGRGKKRGDAKGAYYGGIVEFGYVQAGKFKPGKYMITNAYNAHYKAAQKQTAADIAAAIKRASKL